MKINIWVEFDNLEKIAELLNEKQIEGTIGEVWPFEPTTSDKVYCQISVSYSDLTLILDNR